MFENTIWLRRAVNSLGSTYADAGPPSSFFKRLPVETGLSAHAVAAALGHESVTTTLQSYAKAGAGAAARQERVLTVLAGGKEEDLAS